MSRATEAYTRLTDALAAVAVPCRQDPRFIEDGYPVDELAPICHDCPVIALCRDYAAIAKPKAGVWAGQRWGGVSRVRR